MRDVHVLRAALAHPWAITATMMPVVAQTLARHLAGRDLSAAEHADLGTARSTVHPPAEAGSTAVMPVLGTIVPRGDSFTEVSGTASADRLTADIRRLASDPNIARIVFDVDSPGGSVAGITELAAAVRLASAAKPTVAVVNHQMASAAYWAMSGARELVSAPLGHAGSIGVFALHQDLSQAFEREGIANTLLYEGKHKVEGNPFEPLTGEARDRGQALIATAYEQFVTDVAVGRGTTPDAVRAGYGEGSVLSAVDALAEGLIDRVATLADVLAEPVEASPTAEPRAAVPVVDPEAAQAQRRRQHAHAEAALLG